MSKFCMKCGKSQPDDAKYCNECSFAFPSVPEDSPRSSTAHSPITARQSRPIPSFLQVFIGIGFCMASAIAIVNYTGIVIPSIISSNPNSLWPIVASPITTPTPTAMPTTTPTPIPTKSLASTEASVYVILYGSQTQTMLQGLSKLNNPVEPRG